MSASSGPPQPSSITPLRVGTHTGTVDNEIRLSPYHQLSWMVSSDAQAELKTVISEILAGTINTQVASGPVSLPVKSSELTLWVSGSSTEHIDRWVAKYELANPNVKVYIEAIPSVEIIDRWKVSIAAGTGPDLILNDSAYMFPEWARSGLMLPIDDLLSGKLDGFSSTAIANVTVDGRIYGVPYISYGMAMFYNKLLLPTPPETMDELANLVRMKQKITLFQSAYFLFPVLAAFDGQLVDANGRCIADQNGGFLQGLQYLQELVRDGALITTDWTEYTDQFNNGQAAMTINGAWMLVDFQEALGENLGVALIPRGSTAAAPLTGLNAFFINPNSRNPQLAVDLALFLSSPEAQADLDIYSIPVRTDIAFEAGDPMAVFMQAAGTGYPEILLTNNFYGPFEAMVLAVFGNGSDPASALRDACEQMNSLNGK